MFGMLESLKALDGFTIHAMDGEIGSTEDVLWDDAAWMVRYLVVDTGKWLPGRRVLISPASVEFVGWDEHEISVNLTSDQVRNSPEAASDEPVSRQHEEALSAYYGWPSYWTMDPFGYEPMSLPVPLPEGTVPRGSLSLRRSASAQPGRSQGLPHRRPGWRDRTRFRCRVRRCNLADRVPGGGLRFLAS